MSICLVHLRIMHAVADSYVMLEQWILALQVLRMELCALLVSIVCKMVKDPNLVSLALISQIWELQVATTALLVCSVTPYQ
jgi:hypothetical protein